MNFISKETSKQVSIGMLKHFKNQNGSILKTVQQVGSSQGSLHNWQEDLNLGSSFPATGAKSAGCWCWSNSWCRWWWDSSYWCPVTLWQPSSEVSLLQQQQHILLKKFLTLHQVLAMASVELRVGNLFFVGDFFRTSGLGEVQEGCAVSRNCKIWHDKKR